MKIGMIGIGNMGSAIISGYLANSDQSRADIYIYDKDQQKMSAMAADLGIKPCSSAIELTQNSDFIFLAVKPDVLDSVMQEIVAVAGTEKVFVSMAGGRSIASIEAQGNGTPIKVIRIMPNTPAMVNESMTAVSRNSHVNDDEFDKVGGILSCIGRVETVPEKLMDAVTGVSGSSPAYVYLFIEAMADGAVLAGMPRKQAYVFAAQAVLGAAKMVLTTGMHPGDLKDMVCSPGGITIEAVRKLEEKGFRSATMEAVLAACEKSANMGN